MHFRVLTSFTLSEWALVDTVSMKKTAKFLGETSSFKHPIAIKKFIFKILTVDQVLR